MTVIGLTGGIASGKSTAAEILRELGASIIDGDRLGHRSYEPGTPGFQKVVNAFGHDIVAKDGTIDRRVLGGKVFGAPGQLERLNAIVWPEIRTLIVDEIRQIRAQEELSIIVIEAAVLLEAKWQDLCDEVWVVTTPVEVAVARLKSRNNLSDDAAMARINSQMSNKERTEAADVKIENASTEDELRAKVEKAWRALHTRLGRKAAPRPAAKPAATKTGSVKRGAAKPASKATTSKAAASKPKAAAKPAATKAAASKPAAAKPAAKPAAAKASASKPAAAAKPKTAAKPATAKAAAKPSSTRTTTSKAAAKPVALAKAAGKPASAKATAPKANTKPASAKAASPARAATTTSKPAARPGGRAK